MACDPRVIDFLNKMIGPLFTTISGYYWKIDPEHVIQNVCYNIFLIIVAPMFSVLFICTVLYKELEITSISILSNFALTSFLFTIIHIDLYLHRKRATIVLNVIFDWVEFKRRSNTKSLYEHFSFIFIRDYRAPLIWTTWACFMVSTPLFEYLFYGRSYSLPFPLWFPFKTNNPLGYLAAYAFEIYSVHSFCSFVVSCVPLFIVVCIGIFNEYNSLIDSIRSMHEDALAMYKEQLGESSNVPTDPVTDEEYFDLYYDSIFQNCCERCLKQINIRHLQIYSLIVKLSILVKLGVTLTLTLAYLTVGLALCSAVIENGSNMSKATFTAIGMMELVLIWIVCYMSQMLILKGEEVREELYFTKWYHWPEGMKRSLRLMLVRSLFPPHLSAAFIDIKADYITFAVVVNSVYSFINLVYAFLK